jgi:hypothetical protein
MMLLGCEYRHGKNIIWAHCGSCHNYAQGMLDNKTILYCKCGKEELLKPVLYYLKSTTLRMIIYSLKHVDKNKEFIGVIITNNTVEKPKTTIPPEVFQEIEYLKNFRTYKIGGQLKKDLQKHPIDSGVWLIETLCVTTSHTQALIEEKLHIKARKTLEPAGYNTCFMLETLRKNRTS